MGHFNQNPLLAIILESLGSIISPLAPSSFQLIERDVMLDKSMPSELPALGKKTVCFLILLPDSAFKLISRRADWLKIALVLPLLWLSKTPATLRLRQLS